MTTEVRDALRTAIGRLREGSECYRSDEEAAAVLERVGPVYEKLIESLPKMRALLIEAQTENRERRLGLDWWLDGIGGHTAALNRALTEATTAQGATEGDRAEGEAHKVGGGLLRTQVPESATPAGAVAPVSLREAMSDDEWQRERLLAYSGEATTAPGATATWGRTDCWQGQTPLPDGTITTEATTAQGGDAPAPSHSVDPDNGESVAAGASTAPPPDGAAYIAHVVGCARALVRGMPYTMGQPGEGQHNLLRQAVQELEAWEREATTAPKGGADAVDDSPSGSGAAMAKGQLADATTPVAEGHVGDMATDPASVAPALLPEERIRMHVARIEMAMEPRTNDQYEVMDDALGALLVIADELRAQRTQRAHGGAT
jgi:hypothetical protein